MCRTVFILLFSILPVLPLPSQNKIEPVTVPEQTRAFGPGEMLTMTIQYRCLGIRSDVGYAIFDVGTDKPINGRQTYLVNARGSTVPFFDKFFKVRDSYQARFFADNGRPLMFHRSVYEGGYSLTNDFIWNMDTDEIHSYCQYISSGRIKDTTLIGDRHTYDVLSIVYSARNIDFECLSPGTVFPYTFVIDEEKYDIYFRYEGREIKKIPQMGTFRTLKIAAKVVEGEVFNGDYEIILHVTDDRNHIPLWIESPIIVGSVLARLTDYKNIRHPLTSRISD